MHYAFLPIKKNPPTPEDEPTFNVPFREVFGDFTPSGFLPEDECLIWISQRPYHPLTCSLGFSDIDSRADRRTLVSYDTEGNLKFDSLNLLPADATTAMPYLRKALDNFPKNPRGGDQWFTFIRLKRSKQGDA